MKQKPKLFFLDSVGDYGWFTKILRTKFEVNRRNAGRYYANTIFKTIIKLKPKIIIFNFHKMRYYEEKALDIFYEITKFIPIIPIFLHSYDNLENLKKEIHEKNLPDKLFFNKKQLLGAESNKEHERNMESFANSILKIYLKSDLSKK
jgi:hypothetical protein